MGELTNLKFYSYEGQLWCIYSDGRNLKVEESDRELIMFLIDKISTFYPQAYKALCDCYQRSAVNQMHYQYLIVKRFCNCNFCKLHDEKDVNVDGKLNTKKVNCPLRGECHYEGVICFPKFNSSLSVAEQSVMRLLYEGKSRDVIASNLFISPHTVKNHIKSAYCKMGVHDEADFIRYAKQNKLFETI